MVVVVVAWRWQTVPGGTSWSSSVARKLKLMWRPQAGLIPVVATVSLVEEMPYRVFP